MKKLILFILFGLFILSPITTEAQILKKIGKKAKKSTEQKIDKTIDKGLDEVEDEIDGKNKEEIPVEEKGDGDQNKENKDKTSSNEIIRPWSKFDFVPGDVILFEDRLENELNGEFPSKWDIYKGNVENAFFCLYFNS